LENSYKYKIIESLRNYLLYIKTIISCKYDTNREQGKTIDMGYWNISIHIEEIFCERVIEEKNNKDGRHIFSDNIECMKRLYSN
jgi:hypothetical protein